MAMPGRGASSRSAPRIIAIEESDVIDRGIKNIDLTDCRRTWRNLGRVEDEGHHGFAGVLQRSTGI